MLGKRLQFDFFFFNQIKDKWLLPVMSESQLGVISHFAKHEVLTRNHNAMKKSLILIVLVSVSLKGLAQYPSPANFDWSGEYVMLDEWTDCNGEAINGPGYCTTISWNTPDTSITNALLTGYKVYYQKLDSNSPYIFSSLVDTVLTFTEGILGEMWVTAIYENPLGESEPSNLIKNNDLLIPVEKVKVNLSLIEYYKTEQLIKLKKGDIENVIISNINGQTIMNYKSPKNSISVSTLKSGVYFVTVISSSTKKNTLKIMK